MKPEEPRKEGEKLSPPRRPRHGPVGDKLGAVAIITGRPVSTPRYAIEAVEKVHGVGALPPLEIGIGRISGEELFGGSYRFVAERGCGLVLVDWASKAREFGFVHEIGHFLDHQGLGEPGTYASPDHPLLDGWRAAVEASATVVLLRQLHSKTRVAAQAGGPLATVLATNIEKYEYLLKPAELFARSYSQYIVARTKRKKLREHLDYWRESGELLFWDDDEFDAIADQLDATFVNKGWRQ